MASVPGPAELVGGGVAPVPQFEIDAKDPVARLLRRKVKLDWFGMWLVALLIYGPIEKLILPSLGHYLRLDGGIASWCPHVEALLTGFVEFPYFLAYYLWTGRGIPVVFRSLVQNQCFSHGGRLGSFLESVEGDFDRWRWPALSAALAVGAVAIELFLVWPSNQDATWFGDRPYARALALLLMGIVAYAVFQTVIREVLTVVWLRRLWKGMAEDLSLRPYHPDGAGGLGAIGEHAIYLLCFLLVLALFALGATLLPVLPQVLQPEQAQIQAVRLWSPAILLVWLLWLTLTPILFYLLLWPPHEAMRRKRDERLRKLSRRIEQQTDLAEGLLVAASPPQAQPPVRTPSEAVARDEDERRKQSLALLKELKGLYREIKSYPIWPMSAGTRRLFSLTPFLPTAYSALIYVVNALR